MLGAFKGIDFVPCMSYIHVPFFRCEVRSTCSQLEWSVFYDHESATRGR